MQARNAFVSHLAAFSINDSQLSIAKYCNTCYPPETGRLCIPLSNVATIDIKHSNGSTASVSDIDGVIAANCDTERFRAGNTVHDITFHTDKVQQAVSNISYH